MTALSTTADFAQTRYAMVVSQLRPNGVNDVRVVEAMNTVPREAFLPSDRRASAYIDRAIPIGDGRAMNPPLATALLIDAAAISPSDKVLLVGAATGYALAVLIAMGVDVVAVESDARLADLAEANVPGAVVIVAEMAAAVADHGPFDAIVIDGAVEQVPDALVGQLTPNGRLTTGIVTGGMTRLAVGRRGGAGFGLSFFVDSEAVVLPGFARPKSFVF